MYAAILLMIMSSTVVRAAGPLAAIMMTCESSCNASAEDVGLTDVTCAANDAMSCCGDSPESGCCTSGNCDCTCCVHVVALTPLPTLDTSAELDDNYTETPGYECNYYHLRGSSTFRPPLV